MPRKPPPEQFTPLEFEIMSALWATGPANVATVQEALHRQPPLAYTTVQTMLNILKRKGKVTRVLKGRAYEYAPALSREGAAKAALRDLIDRLFGGSAESLVMSLIEQRDLTREKLARLNRLLAESASKEDRRGRT